jgi:hypothetical protein
MNEEIKNKIVKDIIFCDDMGAFSILFENDPYELIININQQQHPNAKFFIVKFPKEIKGSKIRKIEYKPAYYEGCVFSTRITHHKPEFLVYFDKFGIALHLHINDALITYRDYNIELFHEIPNNGDQQIVFVGGN